METCCLAPTLPSFTWNIVLCVRVSLPTLEEMHFPRSNMRRVGNLPQNLTPK